MDQFSDTPTDQDLVEVRLRAAICAAARDVGKKSRKACRSRASAAATVSLACRYSGRCRSDSAAELLAVERHRLVDEVVHDLGRRVHGDRHGGVEGDDRASRRAFRARMRSSWALATSTSARATSDFGRVPTSKKPRAERRFSSARSSACSCTRIKRWLKRVFVYASFTVERDQLTLQLDVLDRDLGELSRRVGRREVLAEVEEELREQRPGPRSCRRAAVLQSGLTFAAGASVRTVDVAPGGADDARSPAAAAARKPDSLGSAPPRSRRAVAWIVGWASSAIAMHSSRVSARAGDLGRRPEQRAVGRAAGLDVEG